VLHDAMGDFGINAIKVTAFANPGLSKSLTILFLRLSIARRVMPKSLEARSPSRFSNCFSRLGVRERSRGPRKASHLVAGRAQCLSKSVKGRSQNIDVLFE